MEKIVKLQNSKGEGMSVRLFRCRTDDVSHIMGLENFRYEEVQKFDRIRTERDKKIYLFSLDEKKICELLSRDKKFLIMAVSENKALGFISAMGVRYTKDDKNIKELYIIDMVVLKEYRRLGIGHLLIETLKEYGIENGWTELNALASADNTPIINISEKTGAMKFSRDPHSIAGNEDLTKYYYKEGDGPVFFIWNIGNTDTGRYNANM